jgi:hypothetical protein
MRFEFFGERLSGSVMVASHVGWDDGAMFGDPVMLDRLVGVFAEGVVVPAEMPFAFRNVDGDGTGPLDVSVFEDAWIAVFAAGGWRGRMIGDSPERLEELSGDGDSDGGVVPGWIEPGERVRWDPFAGFKGGWRIDGVLETGETWSGVVVDAGQSFVVVDVDGGRFRRDLDDDGSMLEATVPT